MDLGTLEDTCLSLLQYRRISPACYSSDNQPRSKDGLSLSLDISDEDPAISRGRNYPEQVLSRRLLRLLPWELL